jgi:histidinol-phosphate aminotransferase
VKTPFVTAPGSGTDERGVAEAIDGIEPAVVWLCHPNNPTGTAFPLHVLDELTARHPSTLFAVDESYLPLAPGLATAACLLDRGNVLVLRSLTKDAGLAGVRIGYVMAAEPIADAVRRVLPPWSVSAVAQAAGLAALGDAGHLERAVQAVAASRAHLTAGLARLGYEPFPSLANFILVRVGQADSITSALLARGFAVRDCTSFGLPDCIRIGVRAIGDQQRLLDALAEVANG